MSATEVIEMIKKLSPEEQAEVREFVRSCDTHSASAPRYASDTELEAVCDKVFEDNRDLLRRLAQ
jgi:hypothetical protein